MGQDYEAVAHKYDGCDLNRGDHGGTLGANALSWPRWARLAEVSCLGEECSSYADFRCDRPGPNPNRTRKVRWALYSRSLPNGDPPLGTASPATRPSTNSVHPFFALEGDIDAARELVETAGSELAQLFVYPGDRHLFTDSSLLSYDADAAALVVQRSREFLGQVG